jgi:F420-0:gamma-glutamyl ligase
MRAVTVRLSEWIASLLVVLGVSLMISDRTGSPWWVGAIGVAMLTIGVRLAIDCGKKP